MSLLVSADAEARLGLDVLRTRLNGHARTVYGRERLAAIEPSSDRATVAGRLERAGEMQAVLGFDDPLPLSSAEDLRPLLQRIGPEGSYADGEDLAAVGKVLATLRALHGYLKARQAKYPALWRVAQRIVVLQAVEECIGRTVDDQGRIKDDASPELLRATRTLADRQGRLRETLMRALRAAIAEGYATEEQPTIRGGRAVIPVRAEAKRKVQGFVHDVSSSGQTVYIEPAASLDLNNEIRELEAERRREIERLLRAVTSEVRQRRTEIEAGLDALGHLDALAAIGRLGNELDALVPALNDDGAIRLVRARNPVLALHFHREVEHARAEGESVEARTVVPLDLELGADFTTLVITGPNAGGKSVAMKAVGVLCLMAQCGWPVPAAPGTTFPLFTRLIVDLGDRQSIQEDLSTFTSHLAAIRQMLAEADARTLVLIDEAGTGTDPAEGGALAEAVLRRLTARGVRTIATTHHGTLKAFAHTTEGIENGSMQFDRATLAPTYRFQAGVPGSSYAFEIAARVGLDEAVVSEARRLVGGGKTALEDLIADFEQRTQAAEEHLAEADARAKEAERIRADYQQRLGNLRAERDQLRTEALAQAEQIVQDANAAVENTIREIKEAKAEREATKAARAHLEDTKEAIARRQRTVQQRVRRREQAQPSKSSEAPPTGPIQLGDQVRLDDGATAGEVIELTAKDAVVAFGQMTTRTKLDRLTKVGGPRPQRVEVRAPKADASHGADLAVTRARSRVDVRGQRADEAVGEAMRLVDEAVASGLPSVEILHGKGTGALRQAIREHLAGRGDIGGFESAPWNQGGDGVTVVLLR
ncbi:MAG: endonuclease MutS2 [Rhodothermaceae bacterium]|nr:endonuclease MutS2 [Rhodothermaceae bacterium]